MSGARVLVVDDDRAFRISTAALLQAEGCVVAQAEDGRRAVELLREAETSAVRFHLMLLDLRMPGIDGLGVVEALRVWGNGVPILMISGAGTVDDAVRALHLGADDFLTKPVEPSVLIQRVAELLERRPLSQDDEGGLPAGMIGRASALQPFLSALRKVAPTDTTVLITGETGTGKELAARAVHELSPRRRAPFVAVNCASLAEGILESELFGHVRGAFTGALRDRAGLFEAAGSGTIFLDEIGEISVAMQQRLLRVLQEREVVRVGATNATKVHARVVAATNRDLRWMVGSGRFREDLLYRLLVFPLVLPPLRDRVSDIPLLVLHALRVLKAGNAAREQLSCSPFAMRLLRAYEWPGNIRQLFATLETAAIHADFGVIGAQHLPEDIRKSSTGGSGVLPDTEWKRYRAGESTLDEREAIATALDETGGALTRAAALLGMGRTTLWRKLKAYGMSAGDEPDAGFNLVS
ncbi:MAG: sigma-54 dependent transcriptional regulator [Gemmatimonadaceae bacterium]